MTGLPLAVLLACRPQVPVQAPLPPVEVPGAELSWFEVHGATKHDVLRSMLDRAPRLGTGAHVAAATSWAVHWHVPQGDDGGCDLDTAYVTRSISVELPRWTAPDPDLQADWDAYVVALARHESGHVQRIEHTAESLLPALRAAGCDEASRTGHLLLEEIDRANGRYDDATNYGNLQGADFFGDDLPDDVIERLARVRW